jgi:hypothetical protein
MPKVTAVVPCLLCLAACGGSRVPVAADLDAAAGTPDPVETAGPAQVGDDCLHGVWTLVEQGRTKTFAFRADHTGEEVRTATDTRRLMWRLRADGTVRVSYPEQLDEDVPWRDLVVDCAAGTLSTHGVRYAKRE